MEFNAQSLSNNLKNFRNKSGLTQKQLSEITGINRNYISSIERNSINPGINNLSKIAEALEVTLDDLLYDNLSYFNKIIQTDDKILQIVNKELSSKTIDELGYYSSMVKCFLRIK